VETTKLVWYWYIARGNEIFLDLDSPAKASRAISKLRRTLRRKMLPIKAVYFYRSLSRGKYHLIIILSRSMPAGARALWAVWLGSDVVRGLYTLERLRRGIKAADLLIVVKPFEFRASDFKCRCPAKHKARRITDHCPIMAYIHGHERTADYFSRNLDRKVRKRGPVIPIGRVPLSRIVNT
jgi:hypothetical protein